MPFFPRPRRELEAEINLLRKRVETLESQRDELQRFKSTLSNRRAKAAFHLSGAGIEIGALHKPLKLPLGATARYVDMKSREENIAAYPHLDPAAIVETSIQCNGETLDLVADESMDFVIANHMLEHCMNPLRTLEHFLRVTKPGGILYVSVPDKRFSFDRERPVTPFSHILKDYQDNIQTEPMSTYEEWCRFVDPAGNARIMFKRQTNIHFHVWTFLEAVEIFQRMETDLGLPVTVLEAVFNRNEAIVIAKKERNQPDIQTIRESVT